MKSFYSRVFGWLFIGLILTFATGGIIASSEALTAIIFATPLYWVFMIAEVVLAIVLGARINKMKATTTKILYMLYTILSGLTFASIFILFQLQSILVIFLVAAISFGLFAILGKYTKIDLSKIGTYLVMALIGIIIIEIANIFILNHTLDIIACIIGLVIFFGYTAYDMQRITKYNDYGYTDDNMAICGAFSLYLDFINILLKLIRMFGKRRD